MPKTELKPCPCCGGVAQLDRHDLFCDECHLVIRFDDFIYSGEAQNYEEAEELAINIWNTRIENDLINHQKDLLETRASIIKVYDKKIEEQKADIAKLEAKIKDLYKEIERIALMTVPTDSKERF